MERKPRNAGRKASDKEQQKRKRAALHGKEESEKAFLRENAVQAKRFGRMEESEIFGKTKLLIIGGGAAGLMAAITAARQGCPVVLMEKNPVFGKKLSATGNGKCNFTNLLRAEDAFRGSLPSFPETALAAFPPERAIEWFRELGIEPKEREGFLYPLSDQAISVTRALVREAERLKIQLMPGQNVKGVFCDKDPRGRFTVRTETGSLFADRVLLATGSKAAPATGSDGSGYRIAEALGHHLIPVVPALCGIRCAEPLFSVMAGVRVEAELVLELSGGECHRETGELQLTDYGLSGFPAFQISRYVAYALREGSACRIRVCFLDFSEERLMTMLEQRSKQLGKGECRWLLDGLVHERLGEAALLYAGLRPEQPADALGAEEHRRLASFLREFTVYPKSVNDFAKAQCAAGGVSTEEVDPRTMESKLVPGLYFCGELLDIDGRCGGYNLQWAWSSGYAAGLAAGGKA